MPVVGRKPAGRQQSVEEVDVCLLALADLHVATVDSERAVAQPEAVQLNEAERGCVVRQAQLHTQERAYAGRLTEAAVRRCEEGDVRVVSAVRGALRRQASSARNERRRLQSDGR